MVTKRNNDRDHENERDQEWSRWMALAQDGDRQAYERLLRDILPFLRALAARHHRGGDRVEDVVQDVLLTLHRVRHTYDPTRPFSRWLAAIAVRRSIDALRRRGRLEASEVNDGSTYETFADPAANREIEKTDWAGPLKAAISGLSPNQREAVELLKLKELSLTEASRVSGKSVAALKVNVHRALKALGNQLKRR